MSHSDWVLAIDIGTTATKALAVTARGEVLAQAEHAYPHLLDGDRAEQDPDEILAAVRRGIDDVVRECGGGCVATSFSAYMHGLLAVDEAGRPRSRCWTWADRRSRTHAEALHRDDRAAGLLARTGTPVHAMSPLAKLLWWREHDRAGFDAAHRFVSIKEYVLANLCGDWVVDESTASATGLFGLRSGDWDPEALALAGVDPARLSPLVPTRARLTARSDAGLPAELVVVGATDGVLANLGVGATTPGVLAVSLGTSGAARTVVAAPTSDPAERLFCYALDRGEWVVGGAIQNAGIVLRWLGDLLGPPGRGASEQLRELAAAAAEVPAGSDGLVFLPLLVGERFAAWSPDARGVVAGLSLDHGRGHLARAALEGICLCLRTVVRAVEAMTRPADEVRFGGGFANSPLVREMLADVLGRPVTMPESAQASALGAARLAWRELGDPDSWRDGIAHRHDPRPDRVAIYDEVAARHERAGEWS